MRHLRAHSLCRIRTRQSEIRYKNFTDEHVLLSFNARKDLPSHCSLIQTLDADQFISSALPRKDLNLRGTEIEYFSQVLYQDPVRLALDRRRFQTDFYRSIR